MWGDDLGRGERTLTPDSEITTAPSRTGVVVVLAGVVVLLAAVAAFRDPGRSGGRSPQPAAAAVVAGVGGDQRTATPMETGAFDQALSDARPRPSQPVSPGAAVTVAPVPDEARSLVDIAGAGSFLTKEIIPAGQWSVAWAYDCSWSPSAANFFALTIDQLDPPPGIERTGARADGVESYAAGSPLRLVIDSDCPWTVKAYDGDRAG